MAEEILRIKSLYVRAGKKEIIKGLDLNIGIGKPYILLGPNGAGKSTLLMAVAGIISGSAARGKILYFGKDISTKAADQRARLGISSGFQMPPEIKGVKLKDMIKICTGKSQSEELSADELKLAERFKLTEFLERDINVDFSGGEKKRAELMQVLLMRPKLLLIDEPDSGVDIESLKFIGTEIADYIKKNNASALIITHQGSILEYLKAEKAFVLLNGRIECSGRPEEIITHISKKGYEGCEDCKSPMKNG